MKYFEMIDIMINNSEYGFSNIVASSEEFKNKIIVEIEKANCSIATARIFIGFIEVKLEDHMPIEMSNTMFEAAVCVGNCYGLDPDRYSEVITHRDVEDLKVISSFSTSK